jgi:enoyl-CoA hydratase/carnithine racemase
MTATEDKAAVDEEVVLYRHEGRVAILTLNRPEARNALSKPLLESLHRHIDRAEHDSGVGALVLTGMGPAFCAGADLKESAKGMEQGDFESRYERANLSMALHQRLPRLGKPVIAAVNGFAVAGGCGVALSCDVVIASDHAKFGYPEVKRGLVPAMVMVSLSRIVGKQQAMDLLLTGRLISSEEAQGLGMVTRVVPHDELLTEATAYAQEVGSHPATALRFTKDLFRQVIDMEYGQAMEHARDVNQMIRQTKQAKQGASSFGRGEREPQ